MVNIKTLYDDNIKERTFLVYWNESEEVRINSELLLKKNTVGKTTFYIGNIKTDTDSLVVVVPVLCIYDINKEVISRVQTKPLIITQKYHDEIIIFDTPLNGHYYSINLLFHTLLPTTNVTRVLFNRLLFADGYYNKITYNEPLGHLPESDIHFINNFYIELHNEDNNSYLQIIRPNYDSITTETLKPSKNTIICPHLKHNESNI